MQRFPVYFCKTLYMFQTGFSPIIRSSKLNIQRQVFVRPILLPASLTLYVQFWAPDDGRETRLKHVVCVTEIEWETLHLVGCTVRIVWEALTAIVDASVRVMTFKMEWLVSLAASGKCVSYWHGNRLCNKWVEIQPAAYYQKRPVVISLNSGFVPL